MRIFALLLPLLLLQEDSRIDELIKKLSDTSIDVREEASRELVRIGAPALPALEKAAASEDAELRDRAGVTIRRIRARRRAAELGAEKIIPAELQKKMPDLLERVGAEDPEEKVKLHEDLTSAVENGTLREQDLAWIGVLLKGPVNPKLRTVVYVDARKWWYAENDAAIREAGRKILLDLGQDLLKDWPRLLVRIADTPDEAVVFDDELVSRNRSGEDEGKVSAAAIAELAQMGLPEVVPILVDIATDYGADPEARKAAIQAVSAIYKKRK